jgi:NAD(P)H dehydrogenase (quinone)
LIDAAVAARVGHIVKLSAMGPASRLNPLAWHMEIEAHLSRQPVASTALRPSAFADILIRRAGGQVSAGSWTGAAADGRVNFIDTRDIAKAARVALLEDIHPESQRLPSDRATGLDHAADRGGANEFAWPSRRLHQSVA